MNRGLGWKPDVPDIRDQKFAFSRALIHEVTSLSKIPVRGLVPWRKGWFNKKSVLEFPVLDQLGTSSCTGHSVASMLGLVSGWDPRSRLAIYWEGRKRIGETGQDSGAFIRDVIKGTVDVGAPVESLWPFAEDKVLTEPSRTAIYSGARHKSKTYHRLETRQDFLSCLAAGYPFVIGFMVYNNFMEPNGLAERYGLLQYPTGDEGDVGGHAVVVIGYDNDFRNSVWGKELVALGINVPETVYIVRNSWSDKWGRKGNFAVDSRYFENTNLADDAWTVRVR